MCYFPETHKALSFYHIILLTSIFQAKDLVLCVCPDTVHAIRQSVKVNLKPCKMIKRRLLEQTIVTEFSPLKTNDAPCSEACCSICNTWADISIIYTR